MSPDWDRVLFYARRIKQLGVDDSREVVMSHIDISVYKFLSVYRPTTTLSHRIQLLGCAKVVPPLKCLLISTSFSALCLSISSWPVACNIRRLFTSLRYTSPSIKVLKMSFSNPDIVPTADVQLSELVSSLPRLRTLHCIPFPPSQHSFTCLSRISSLRDLHCDIAFDLKTQLFWTGQPWNNK